MDRYYGYYESQQEGSPQQETVGSGYMSKVYGWMFLGLLVTTAVSLATFSSPSLAAIAQHGYLLFFLAEIGIVLWLSARVTRMAPATAALWFLVFAALNGFVLTPIVAMYTGGTVALAFGVACVSFGVMSIYGAVTKSDLRGIGTIAFLGLIGVLAASLLNIFLRSSELNWIISYAGVAVFTILTAWDTQRIKKNSIFQRYAVMGSLILYLDFINIFLFLLSIFGGGRRR